MTTSSVTSFFRKIRVAMINDLPSEEHIQAWDRFEVYLALRSNFTFLSKVIYTALWIALGKANYIQSQTYIDAGEPHNEEFSNRY